MPDLEKIVWIYSVNNLKIFISYHRRCPLFSGDSFQPIHVGRALARTCTKDGEVTANDYNWLCEHMIGDDTKNNISALNREFCETTALYWVWQNLKEMQSVNYVGFMQYRRHFIFEQQFFTQHGDDLEKKAYGCVHMKFNSMEAYCKKIGLNPSKIKSLLVNNNGILPVSGDLSFCGVTSLWDDYVQKIPGVHIDDLIRLVDIVGLEDREVSHLLNSYLDQPKKLMYQMFILPVEDFKNYCSFLFPILFKVHSVMDTSFYTLNGRRTIGYLAEILFGLYFTKMQSKNYTRLGVTYLEGI